MKRLLSPIERARQILMALDLEDSNNFKNKKSESPLPQPEEESSEESSSVEDRLKEPEESAYTGQQTLNKPLIELNSHNIVQGFIFSEVLGRPVSRRRGRW